MLMLAAISGVLFLRWSRLGERSRWSSLSDFCHRNLSLLGEWAIKVLEVLIETWLLPCLCILTRRSLFDWSTFLLRSLLGLLILVEIRLLRDSTPSALSFAFLLQSSAGGLGRWSSLVLRWLSLTGLRREFRLWLIKSFFHFREICD